MESALKLFSVLLFSLTALFSHAQESDDKSERYLAATLLREGGRPTGGFFSPSVKITQVNGQTAALAGGQLAMVLGHQFNIGAALNVMLSETSAGRFGSSTFLPHYLEMGYAGLLLEPVFFDRSVIHFTTPAVVGVGLATLNHYRFWEGEYYSYSGHESDAFFVVEPGANLEINIARPLRFFVGGSYRFVFDSNIFSNSDRELSGFNLNFGLKLGWF